MVPLFRCRTDNLLQALRYAAQFGSLRYRRCSRKGVGGIIELAPGYFPAVYSSITKAGGLCIADEVQSRFAHTGSHFWGFETQGIVPDIVTTAKVNKLHEVC
ncbi:unnamed protein product [Camellia sinensis]